MSNQPVSGPSIGPSRNFRWLTAGEGSVQRPWDLIVVPQSSGPDQWRVALGNILDGSGKVGSYLTCTNPDHSFALAADGHIVREFNAKEPTEYTLAYYATWPITDDYIVELSDPGNEFVRALIPLYHIRSAEVYGAQKVGELWAERIEDRLVHSYFQKADKARRLAPDIAK